MMFRYTWTSFLIVVSCIIGLSYTWMAYRRRVKEIPIHWKRAGIVENLVIYPLKSGKAVELKEADCSEFGLQGVSENNKYLRDRCFIIYQSSDHEGLSILKWRKGVLISVEHVEGEVLRFRAPECEDFKLHLSSAIASQQLVKIYLHGGEFETVDCGDEIAKWLSQYLSGTNGSHRLGCFVENFVERPNVRKLVENKNRSLLSVYKHWRSNDSGLYSDLSSYLIINSMSVDHVNNKLSQEDRFTYHNMRPNIVVKGEKEYAEDNWKWIKFGDDVILRTIKPCTRCMKITINQLNAKKNKHMQPYKILKSYRTIKKVTGIDVEGDLPVFGLNMGLYNPGRVKIGDPVYVNIS